MSVSLIYFTCGSHDPAIEAACRRQLEAARGGAELVSVAINQPVPFGDVRLAVPGQRGALAQCRQILRGLRGASGDVAFLVENDVLYHPSHFAVADIVREAGPAYWYNLSVWRVRYTDGHAIRTTVCRQVSGLCGQREVLIAHYERRLARIEANGGVFDKAWSYEPGSFPPPRGFDDVPVQDWRSDFPNLDIRHNRTMTRSKWSPADFRNKRWAEGWEETDGPIPGWGQVSGRVAAFMGGLGKAGSAC